MDRTFHIVDEDERQIEDERIREHEAQPLPTALGSGCCPQCSEPVGMVKCTDGSEYLGCKCVATPGQLRAEIKRLEAMVTYLVVEMEQTKGENTTLKTQLAEVGAKLDGIPPSFIAEDRPTDGKG